MRQLIKDRYFVVPGRTFGMISQGSLALKDVLRAPIRDFCKLVGDVEDDAVRMYGSMEKYFKATQRAFICEFSDRVAKETRDP